MTQMITGDVLHVVPPDELGEHDLQPELQELAKSRYVLVCREGGQPSFFEKLWGIVKRRPIKAVTIVTDQRAEVGEEITVTVRETEMPKVYETASPSNGGA